MSTPEENKAIVRRYQEALNTDHLDVLDEVMSAEVSTPEIVPGLPPGIEGAKAIARMTREAWPDFHTAIEDLIAEGDRVAARILMTGTPQKELFGIRPTGRSFRMTGMYIARIANGKIVEHRGIEDAVGMLQQLGLMPPPG